MEGFCNDQKPLAGIMPPRVRGSLANGTGGSDCNTVSMVCTSVTEFNLRALPLTVMPEKAQAMGGTGPAGFSVGKKI